MLLTSTIQIVHQDDHLPMHVEAEHEIEDVLEIVFLTTTDKARIKQWVLPFLSVP